MKADYPQAAQIACPGTLHHVIGRGIEGSKIFRNERARFRIWGRSPVGLGTEREWGSWGCDRECGEGRYRVARRLFCQAAVGRMGSPAAEGARFLGATPSAVVRAAHSEGLPEMEKYP